MKVKYSKVRERLQNLIGEIPTHAEISRILEKGGLDVSANALSNRLSNDGFLKEEEIEIIERKYAIDLSINNREIGLTELNYYPNVFGSCGNGVTVFDETSEKISVSKDIITNYSASNQYSVISAKGSSMSPAINEDDKLIIQHNLNEQIIDDSVYLFRYNDELFIKRLVNNVDQIVCISENPRFEDRVIVPNGDNFSIVGKVVGLFRSKV